MLKFFIEFSPLLAFFIGYKTKGIFAATLYILIVSIISLPVLYIIEKKINKVNLFSTVLLLISSSLTLISGNSMFIKIKPTILYLLFGILFLVTCFKWEPAIKYVFGTTIKLQSQEKWKALNIRFMCYFFFMALLNEVIWRNFSEEVWVNFKVFGALPVAILFCISQIPFLLRNRINNSKN
jgi:intracellular septation protein